MLAPARPLPSFPITRIAAGPARPVDAEAIAILCLFALAGLIWLAVGWAVMRSGKASPLSPYRSPRPSPGFTVEETRLL